MIKRIGRMSKLKAAGYLFFLGAMVPVLMAGVGLSADFTRLIIAHRQAADTADSVVLAGAHAFNNSNSGSVGTPTLNLQNARSYAQSTFNYALGKGGTDSMMGATEDPQLKNVRITNGNTQVEATITYKLSGFVAMNFLSGGKQQLSFTVTRTAEICTAANDDYCAYPVN